MRVSPARRSSVAGRARRARVPCILADGVAQASLCGTGSVAALIEELQYTLGRTLYRRLPDGRCHQRTGPGRAGVASMAHLHPEGHRHGGPGHLRCSRSGSGRPASAPSTSFATGQALSATTARRRPGHGGRDRPHRSHLPGPPGPGSIPAEFGADIHAGSTRPPGWSRSNSASASPTPWSACVPDAFAADLPLTEVAREVIARTLRSTMWSER